MHNKIILITGASGFIGKALVRMLSQQGYDIRATVRSNQALDMMLKYSERLNLKNTVFYNLGELGEDTQWGNVLKNVDTIIHCAARAHILNEKSNHPLQEFRKINCQATLHLAQEAQAHHVKRMIFISSIGVLGNCSNDTPFNDDTIPNPQLPYAISKLEAEQILTQSVKQMAIVIIRPPLVYGPGVKGNFNKLLQLIEKGLPMPLGRVMNKRHFIGINNLVDFIGYCISSPKAANRTFIVADREVISTTQLIKKLSVLMKKNIILIPIPNMVLKWCCAITGKRKLAEQLLNNLEINCSNAKTILNWEPPYTMIEQLEDTVTYHKTKNS